jgi:hypothetical protein
MQVFEVYDYVIETPQSTVLVERLLKTFTGRVDAEEYAEEYVRKMRVLHDLVDTQIEVEPKCTLFKGRWPGDIDYTNIVVVRNCEWVD